MKKKIIIVSLILLIVAAAVAGALVYNHRNTSKDDTKVENTYQGMLPDVHVLYGTETVCSLMGYRDNMNEAMNRQDIIPVAPDRKVCVQIEKHENKILKISYEVHAQSDERLVDSGAVSDWKENDETIRFDFSASAIMKMGQEYFFCFKLQTEKYDTVNYYARLMVTDTEFVSEQLKFAKDFSDKTFDSTKSQKLAFLIEPDPSLPNDDLGKTTIQSSYSMLIWNTLVPQKTGKTSISAKEFCIKDTGEAGTYTMTYRIKSVNAQKVEEYYNVAETITVWTCAGKQYVLAYDREVNQIWVADEHNIGNSFIDLGIQNFGTADYVESENGQYLAFNINNDIYRMDITTKTVTPIYQFDAADSESLYQTKAKDLRVDHSGNVDYILYGYSLSEEHVGKNGISVLQYNAEKKQSEEKAFLVSELPASILEQELDKLCYIGDETIYMKIGENICYANVRTKESGTLVENLQDGSYAVNADESMLVYNTNGEDYAKSLTIVNLNNGEMQEKEAGEGNVLKVYGYTGENLVYGLAKQADLERYNFFPVNMLKIVDHNMGEIKSYFKDGVFITNVEISDTIINIQRRNRKKKIADDQLLFNTEEQVTAAHTSHWADDVKQKELAIAFEHNLDANTELVIEKQTPVVFDSHVEIDLSTDYQNDDNFYVYGYGKLQGIVKNQAQAQQSARTVYGLVTDQTGKKVWVFEENYS